MTRLFDNHIFDNVGQLIKRFSTYFKIKQDFFCFCLNVETELRFFRHDPAFKDKKNGKQIASFIGMVSIITVMCEMTSFDINCLIFKLKNKST